VVWLSESIGIDSLSGARPCRNRCRVTCVSELSKQLKRGRRDVRPSAYARRYALFTLVGIAGEDDLDAPDLCDGSLSPSVPAVYRFKPREARMSPRTPGNGHARDVDKRRVILDADQSAALREKLLAEMDDIASADLAAGWAREALIAKNSLTLSDAKLLEDAFEQRLSELASSPSGGSSSEAPEHPSSVASLQKTVATESRDSFPGNGIDKSILAVAAPRRYRNREHLRYVAQQACLLCGRKPSDPHHLAFTQPRALGRKVSDEFAVPLCRGHHRAVHRARDERAWWQQAGVDPIKIARRLWKATHRMGRRPSARAQLPRPSAAAGSSDPTPKNEETSATATTQEGTR
jgi:hypothetical protein